ncbi:MAG: hypothetical protein DRN15_01740 [Thermoprotei archaeon]|nr:MAG: hypothetical protein DRM97_03430 [Thermoprotei archaeon]RLF24686.1 MAG: hypothetical protein DRN15_01740 [Thermoprotei archaeon]
MKLEELPPIQQLILKRALEKGSEVRLAELSHEAQKLVRYRASAALHQNSVLLERKGFIERRHDGRAVIVRVRPVWIQPLRRLFGIRAPLCYMGLMNKPMLGRTPIIRQSLNVLKDVNVDVERVVVVASEEGRREGEYCLREYQPDWVIVDPHDYEECFKKIEDKVVELLPREEVICDLTGGTKLMSLALSDVAMKYGLRRFFTLTDARRIIWLVIRGARGV